MSIDYSRSMTRQPEVVVEKRKTVSEMLRETEQLMREVYATLFTSDDNDSDNDSDSDITDMMQLYRDCEMLSYM